MVYDLFKLNYFDACFFGSGIYIQSMSRKPRNGHQPVRSTSKLIQQTSTRGGVCWWYLIVLGSISNKWRWVNGVAVSYFLADEQSASIGLADESEKQSDRLDNNFMSVR